MPITLLKMDFLHFKLWCSHRFITPIFGDEQNHPILIVIKNSSIPTESLLH